MERQRELRCPNCSYDRPNWLCKSIDVEPTNTFRKKKLCILHKKGEKEVLQSDQHFSPTWHCRTRSSKRSVCWVHISLSPVQSHADIFQDWHVNTIWKVREGKKERSSARSYSIKGLLSLFFSGSLRSVERPMYDHCSVTSVTKQFTGYFPRWGRFNRGGRFPKSKWEWLLQRKVQCRVTQHNKDNCIMDVDASLIGEAGCCQSWFSWCRHEQD